MFETFLLVLPEFSMIFLGILLGRYFLLPEGTWKGIEKLVYYVLFPPMLFRSVVNASFTLGDSLHYLAVSIGTMLLVVILSWTSNRFIRANDTDHASVFQCAFRFNSYIGFSVVQTLYGDQGMALMSLLIAIWVPISSFFAVSALAKNKSADPKKIALEIVKNPLIIATLAGLVVHSFGVTLPKSVDLVFARLGTSSLVLGLIAIGVGLRFKDLNVYPLLLSWATALRLVIVPLLAMVTVRVFGLSVLEAQAFLVFAVLPTANSCYILTVNMGGNGSLVAAVMTLQTLFALITMPVMIEMGNWVLGV